MFLNTVINAKRTLDAAKNKFELAKDRLEETRDRIAKYNVVKVRNLVIVLSVINMLLAAAALAVGIVALVKSCRASRKTNLYDDYDYSHFDDDDFEDYDFSLDGGKTDKGEASSADNGESEDSAF